MGQIKTETKKDYLSIKKNELYNYFKKLSGDETENALDLEPEAEDDDAGEPENDVNS